MCVFCSRQSVTSVWSKTVTDPTLEPTLKAQEIWISALLKSLKADTFMSILEVYSFSGKIMSFGSNYGNG